MSRTRFFLFSSVLVFLIFFRGQSALHLAGVVDDACYMRTLYRFLGLGLPECYADFYPPGVSFFWLPAGLLGSLLGWFTGSDPKSWIEPLVGLTSFLLYATSIFLIDRSLRLYRPSVSLSPRWVVVLFLAIPALHYSTLRTFISHSAELFLASLLTLLLVQRRYFWAISSFAVLVLTRVSDAPLGLLILGRLLDDKAVSKKGLFFISAGLILILLPLAKLALFSGYGTSAGQQGSFLLPILQAVSWEQFRRTLFSGHNGMAWSAPWWLFVLSVGCFCFTKISWFARATLVAMGFLLLICIGWTGNGGGLFYRYLIGTYPAAALVWLELLPLVKRRTQRVFQFSLAFQASYVCLVTWLFGTRFGYPIFEQLPSVLQVVKSTIFSVSLLAVSPIGLVIFSWWNPENSEWLGVTLPAYRLSGPALWLLTLVCLGALIWLVRVLISFCYNGSHGRAASPT